MQQKIKANQAKNQISFQTIKYTRKIRSIIPPFFWYIYNWKTY